MPDRPEDLDPPTDPARRRFLVAGVGLGALAVGGAAGVALERLARPGAASAYDKVRNHHPRTTNDALRLEVDPSAVCGIDTTEKAVALTFDDGPDSRYTAKVLDLLAERDIRATFFSIGVNVRDHPDLTKRAVAEGHSIANHTLTHRQLDLLTRDEVAAQIDGCTEELVKVGAGQPKFLRPPHGYTNSFVGAFTAGAGLRSVFWSTCIEHHLTRRSTAEAARSLVEGINPGDVILCHDGSGAVDRPERRRTNRSRTVEALPLMLDALHAKGYRVTDVTGLMALGRPRTSGGLQH